MSTVRLMAVALVMLSACVLHAAPAALTVDVDKPGVTISPTLWGIFFEDINLSADGGIYPEFVRNRSFEDSDQPDHWTLTKADGDKSEMAIDSSRPIDPMNRQGLRVKVDGSATLVNKGYWGMNVVKGEKYQVRLAARAADGLKGPLAVSLQKVDGGELAKGEITGLTSQWKGFSLDLIATGTDPKAQLNLTVSGKGTLWLDMVCVAPAKTWKDHGLRPDLCEMLTGLKPVQELLGVNWKGEVVGLTVSALAIVLMVGLSLAFPDRKPVEQAAQEVV